MPRVFLSAGHGGFESGRRDPGAIAGGTTEAQQMILLRDQIVGILRSRGIEVLAVPDDLSLKGTISWINARARQGDVALEIHADAFANPSVRGASIFYIANNEERKRHAEIILLELLRAVPQLRSRGAKPDTETGVGSLGFCRLVLIPSLLMEVGFLTNLEDRTILINKRQEIALGIANGLTAWVKGFPQQEGEPTYPIIDIKVNNQVYDEQGILVNNNAYIPIDLADRLGVDITNNPNIRLVQYRGVVYVKAVDLREYNISVGWDNETRSVVLRSVLQICPGQLDRIMSYGNTSETQLILFLKSNNENALQLFPDIAKIYREEASIEGVNYDIAFCQMCLETGFLRFGSDVSPSQNNFAGLGAIGGGEAGASFPSARIGVRAHVQHLKAYASLE
ncbi:MAG: N-acetylmuramoyl-L-alanine amidase, partial [Chroococcales cyanobacterium]